MTTAYATERVFIGGLLDSWSGSTLFAPGEVDPSSLPKPSNDPSNPSKFAMWDVVYQSTERHDFAGGAKIDGFVEFAAYQERGTGDYAVRQLLDLARDVFAAGDGSGYFFLEPLPLDPEILADQYYGRGYRIPFVRLVPAGS